MCDIDHVLIFVFFYINFSKLPPYNGCRTSVQPFLNGEYEVGVTFHKIARGCDAGNIISQLVFYISDEDTAYDLCLSYLDYCTKEIIKNIDSIPNNIYRCKTQSPIGSSFYPRIYLVFFNLKLNCFKTAIEIINLVRAFCFRPYQLITFNERAIVYAEISNSDSSMKQETIQNSDKYSVTNSCFDYTEYPIYDGFIKAYSCRINILFRLILNSFFFYFSSLKIISHFFCLSSIQSINQGECHA